ncbi:MAG: hypothetical protein MUF12_00485 [Sediminibacterium sp.]|jgi:hypothetical protein|nr:hypothetical protein [Sediminibacterium sp.]
MSLKKYTLENLPESGKIQFEQTNGRAIVLDENLTDEQCDFLLDEGNNKNAAYYIKPKTKKQLDADNKKLLEAENVVTQK